MSRRRRVGITGMGLVTAGGGGVEGFWALLTAGRTAIRPISAFDASSFRSRIAGECDFDPVREGLSPGEVERMDRAAQLAVVCARQALADSGLTPEELAPQRTGVSLGSAVSGVRGQDREYAAASARGRDWLVDHRFLRPHVYGYQLPSSMAAEVAWVVGAEGPVAVVSNGCTSGLDAVGNGCELVREGSADVLIAGATDAPITPITVACFDAIKATSPNNADPAGACRPFDLHRDGFVLGEGAAVFVLEDWEHARRRGAHVHAEIVGYAARSNAHHMTGLTAHGRELAEAITVAMDDAHVVPDDIDYVNAHGSGTYQNDRHETAAFKRSLGQHAYAVPISSIKPAVGHSLGAIGSIELAACVLAIAHGVIPPTANLTTPDPECDLDYVPTTARERRVDVALCVGSGFGGFQSAVVLARMGRRS